MSNKFTEHLQVLVEDDANRQLINGLNQHPSLQARRLEVLPPVGGWKFVLDSLTAPAVIQGMTAYNKRHLLLLIDFDDHFADRWALYQQHKSALAPAISDRVYLLGCLHEPEKLKAACRYAKSIEKLGRELSDDCAPPPAQNLWQHAHLRHNADELSRLLAQVKPFLFNPLHGV